MWIEVWATLFIECYSAVPKKGDPVDHVAAVYVVDDFDNVDVLDIPEGVCLLGPEAARAMAAKGNLERRVRPLFCLSMAGLGVCFGRLRGRDAVRRAFHLVRWMGGSVIKELHSKRVTHVVADTRLESCHRCDTLHASTTCT